MLYGVRHLWLRTILIARKETRCRHIGYSFRFTASVLLYAIDMAFGTPVVEHWLEREIARWVHSLDRDRDHGSPDPALWEYPNM